MIIKKTLIFIDVLYEMRTEMLNALKNNKILLIAKKKQKRATN